MTLRDLQHETDGPVTIRGTAYNAKAGAVIMTDRDEAVYLQGLREWPKDFFGKRVAAEGTLRQHRIYPEIEEKEGVVSQGMSGEPLVLEFTRYRLED